MYKQGDILLIPYPFTDLSKTKKRPVIVISKKTHKGNYVVAKITSVIRNDNYSFVINKFDTTKPLPKISEVRTNELFTVNHSIVIKKITSLSQPHLSKLLKKIIENIV